MSGDPSSRGSLRIPVLTVCLVVTGYALLRLVMNREYEGATWEQLYSLQAPLPFGHRILIPLLCRPLVDGLGLPIRQAFQVFEILSGFALFLALRWTLRAYVAERVASFFACLFFFVLPFLFLLNYRWPVFYPYDTPSVAFTVLAFGLLVRERWGLAVAVMAVAAVNREIAAFFPLLAFCLLFGRVPTRKIVGWMLVMWAVYFAVRSAIALALPQDLGESLHFHVGDTLRILNNLDWLVVSRLNAVLLLASMGFLPVFWITLRDWLPSGLWRVGLLALLMFIPLLFVGNLYEPRIYGEIAVLLYLPLCLACWGWLSGQRA